MFKLSPQRLSLLIPVLIYSCFITTILTLTLPLKSSNVDKLEADKTTIKIRQTPEKHFQQVKGAIGAIWTGKVKPNFKNDPTKLLRDIFKTADLNKDGFLSIQELARFINDRVKQHIESAISGNSAMFIQVDKSPPDGLVTWEEYHAYFLKNHGLSDEYVNDHDERKHKGLQREVKEAIMRDRAMWSEAARNDPYSLTLDEFLAFKHPESSAANMLGIVDDLLEKFDRDGDDLLTEDEFSTLPEYDFTPLFGEETTVKKQSKQEESNRRKEFVHLVDKNKDGKADRQELLSYVDPRHPRHSLQEAATLMSLADTNTDNKLALEEILNKMELFLGSKMVGTAKSFHEDF